MLKKGFALLFATLLLALSACSANNSTPSDAPSDNPPAQTEAPEAEIQYDYQLKSGEPSGVYDLVFDKMITVTVDPASTRNASNDLWSIIEFDNCVFNGGLTVIGDFHAMVILGGGCSFGAGSIVTCKEATPGVTKDATLDDNYVKVFAGCEGVTVETESAMGVLSDGADFVLNGNTFSKAEIAPDADSLGVFSVYENGSLTYTKLALGNDDSVEYLD